MSLSVMLLSFVSFLFSWVFADPRATTGALPPAPKHVRKCDAISMPGSRNLLKSLLVIANQACMTEGGGELKVINNSCICRMAKVSGSDDKQFWPQEGQGLCDSRAMTDCLKNAGFCAKF